MTDDENNQLATFRKMGSIALNTKNGLICLFINRTYDSTLIYRIVKKKTHRILQFGDSSDCIVPVLSDFVLIDGTHKTKIYDLSLIVIAVVDSLAKSVPLGFLLAPLLKIYMT